MSTRRILVAFAVLATAVAVVSPAPAGAVAAGSVTVSGPASADVGANIQFTISYSCSGDEDCLGVTIDMTYTTMVAAGQTSFSVGDLAPGSAGQVFASAQFPSGTPNGATGDATATLTSSNGPTDTDTMTVTAVDNTPPSLDVSISGPSSEVVGTPIQFVVDYSCSGNADCTNAVIDMSYAVLAASGPTNFPLGTVSTGTSGSVTVDAVFPAGTPHNSTGTATAGGTISNGVGDTDAMSVTAIDNTTPRGIIDISGPSSAPAGTDITFTIDYSCGPQGPCDNATVFVNFSVLNPSGTTSWTIGNMAAGQSGQVTVVAQFPAGTPHETWGSATAEIVIANGLDDADTWWVQCDCPGAGGTTTTSSTTTTVVTTGSYWAYKSRSSSTVSPGGTVDWYIYNDSTGPIGVDGLNWTDMFEPELDPVQFYTGAWTPTDVEGTFEYHNGATWLSIGTFDGTTPAWYVLPASAEGVRATYSHNGGSVLPVTFAVNDPHRIQTTAIRPDRNGDWYVLPWAVSNCADWTSTNSNNTSYCTSVSVVEAAARPDPDIDPEGSNLKPTDPVSFDIEVENDSTSQLPLVDPYLAFHMPAELEYLGWEPITGGLTPSVTVIPDHGQAGRTLVRFDFIGQFDPGDEENVRVLARVAPGVDPGWHDVEVLSGTNDTTHVVTCYSSQAVDSYDIDQDGNTAEFQCSEDSSFDVVEAALTEAVMTVKGEPDLPHLDWNTLLPPAGPCPDFDGFTFFPCVAQTKSLGSASYLLEVTNVGNVDLTEFALYNTLPFVGDSGVTEVLAGTLRGSEWRPTLRSVGLITKPPGSTVTIEYSVDANACRPELAGGGAFPPGCSNSWGPAPPDLATVQAIRLIAAFPAGASWVGGSSIELAYDLDASQGSPFGGEIGWTSFGYTASRLDNGLQLPPSEPRKTGIMIKQPDNGIGSRIWSDLNRDGVRTPDEPGVNGIPVELYTAGGVLVATTVSADLQGDPTKPGYYFFGDRDPGDYYVKFGPAPIGWNTMLPNLGGDDTVDSDGSSSTRETPIISLGLNDFQLNWDMAYFQPLGPLECESAGVEYDPEATDADRRQVNDPLKCPT